MDTCDSVIRGNEKLAKEIEAEHLFSSDTAHTLVALRAPQPQLSPHGANQNERHAHGHSHGLPNGASEACTGTTCNSDTQHATHVYDGGPPPADGQDDASQQRARAIHASYRARLVRNNAERVLELLGPSDGQ
jgi:hypothetical protein